MASLHQQEYHFVSWTARADDLQVWFMCEFVAFCISRTECYLKPELLGARSYYGVDATLTLQDT